ncbi:hypothetical protein CANARDRAFT_195739 [[Candida] arabinofermentans NRRL YB-2248]|uniref:intramembrane prenyl-peptidase Rce1 n=1 Tax=[Candida] arabinofermentans NRRL YB-2248 TaxID=983967 RepID=A0A1E4T584_9ASCO|nr:hypothetical protein CANARDRAFT_195739 [[Candida] arabinofermentans NRRL YB-2248]
MVTQLQATVVYATLVSASYVICLYFRAPSGSRNSDVVIRSRLIRVTAITLSNMLILPYVMVNVLHTAKSYSDVVRYMGLIPTHNTFMDIVKVLGLFITLFAGPVVETFSWGLDSFVEGVLNYPLLQITRDFISAPITEELVYTSVTMALFTPFLPLVDGYQGLDSSGVDIMKLVTWTPLLFGFAHLHHAYGSLKSGKYPAVFVMLNTLIQLTYTTMFGLLTNLIFLGTGSIWCCVIIHCWCNLNGLPKLSVDGSGEFKLLYYALLLVGVIFFKNGFWSTVIGHDSIINWAALSQK